LPEHNVLTDPELHEIKGAAAATANSIPVANGAGGTPFKTPAEYADIIEDELDLSNRFPYGGLYFTTPALSTISVQSTYVKAAGATTATNLLLFDMPVNNRLRYIGTTMRHFHIVLQTTLEFASGTNQIAGLQLWKYDDSAASGALIAHSEAQAIVPSTDLMQLTSHADAMLDENDYIEMHIANHSNTNNMTVNLGYMFLVGMGG
jgi:hypothetical protein